MWKCVGEAWFGDSTGIVVKIEVEKGGVVVMVMMAVLEVVECLGKGILERTYKGVRGMNWERGRGG